MQSVEQQARQTHEKHLHGNRKKRMFKKMLPYLHNMAKKLTGFNNAKDKFIKKTSTPVAVKLLRKKVNITPNLASHKNIKPFGYKHKIKQDLLPKINIKTNIIIPSANNKNEHKPNSH